MCCRQLGVYLHTDYTILHVCYKLVLTKNIGRNRILPKLICRLSGPYLHNLELFTESHSTADTVLPAHHSRKSLADSFVFFFSDKIPRIRDCFSSTDQFDLSPVTPPTAFADFKQVSETEVHKIIMNSPTKSCFLRNASTYCFHLSLSWSIVPLLKVLFPKVLKMPL